MPEALAIVAVFFLCVAVFVYARIQTSNPALQDAGGELARLQQHDVWLRDRLRTAKRENWGHEMVAAIAMQLEAVSRQLDRANRHRLR